MLGLPGLISRPALPTSWLRPQIMSWGESIEKLKMELGMEVGKLVRGCMGGCVKMEVGMEEGMEEVLVRAVGQIVRMGEVKK